MASKALAALILTGVGTGIGLIMAGVIRPAFMVAGLALLLVIATSTLLVQYHDSPPAHPTTIRRQRRLPRD